MLYRYKKRLERNVDSFAKKLLLFISPVILIPIILYTIISYFHTTLSVFYKTLIAFLIAHLIICFVAPSYIGRKQKRNQTKWAFIALLVTVFAVMLQTHYLFFVSLFFLIVSASHSIDLVKKSIKRNTANKEGLDALDGFQFEEYLARFFSKRGHHSKVTSKSHDYGADVIADINGTKTVIQAKRYKPYPPGNVGIESVQQIVGSLKQCPKSYGYNNKLFHIFSQKLS